MKSRSQTMNISMCPITDIKPKSERSSVVLSNPFTNSVKFHAYGQTHAILTEKFIITFEMR